MGFWTRLTSWLGLGGGASRTKQVQTDGVSSLGQRVLRAIGFSAPPTQGDPERLDAFHSSASLFLIQHRVSDSFASVDWTVKRDDEPVDDHPLLALWRKPNDHHTGYIYRYIQGTYRDMLGESFAELGETEPGDPRPFTLNPIPPHEVTFERGRQGGAKTLVARITVGDRDDTVPLSQMIWSKRPNLKNPYARGKGIGHVVGKDVEIDQFAAEFVRAFFHNDATPRGILTSEKAIKKDKRRRLRKQWNQRHRGAGRSHQTAVLPQNSMDYIKLSDGFEHLEITDLRQGQLDLLRKCYGVPPEIIGQTEDSNLAKARAARDHMARYTTRPRLRMHREEWREKVIPLFDDSDRLQLVPDDPVPANLEHRRAVMKEHPHHFTRNEVREEAGKPPREDGDVYPVPEGMQFVEAGDPIIEGQKSANVSKLPDMTDEIEVVGEQKDRGEVVDFPVEVIKQEPSLDPERTAAEIAQVLQAEQIETGLRGRYREEVAEWIARESEMLGVEPNFELLNPLITEHVDRFGAEQVTRITDTTKDHVRSIVRQGIEEGRGPDAIVDDLSGYFLGEGIDTAGFPTMDARSETIARTEMLRASNWGTYQAQRVSGVVEKREWLATLDSRVRDEHAALDQAVVGIDEMFTVDGEEARFPGDFGIPALDINCRCTTAAVINPKYRQPAHTKAGYVAPREMIWKAFDSDLAQSEERFREAVMEVMDDARQTVITRAGRVFGIDVSDIRGAA